MHIRRSPFALLTLLLASSAYAQQAAYEFKEFLPMGGYTRQSFAGSDTRLLYGTDFNRDGRADLVTRSRSAVAVYVNQHDGSFIHYWSIPTEGSSTAVGGGDIDGDNWPDLLVSSPPSAVQRFINNRGNGFTPDSQTLSLQPTGRHPMINDLLLADFNRDNKLDIVALDSDPANPDRAYTIGGSTFLHRTSAALLWGQGGGAFAADSARPRVPVAEYPLRARVIDLNDDGNLDVVTNSGTSLHLLQNHYQSGGLLPALSLAPVSANASVHGDILGVSTGDLNADDRKDLAITYYTNAPPTGRAYRLKFYRNATPHPQLRFVLEADPAEITLPAPGNGLAVANFNDDAHNDIIVGLESAGAASIALYAGRGGFSFDPPVTINGGFSAGELVTGDFNSDNRPDIAVVDIDNNRVAIYLHR
ncbi:FG-GAP repeat domain-containing protein [Tahibacter amnicola]|uniref:VCBS repeat-containing protein n=1 Tax=Tahibacter amnicola TaxID=2976241 RepID=A0ABY6BIH1_9GAMM|nr:VCBS repeat-containing protein [Tahibacter amnicola]UXI67662.1 VCBS repeat-containing protein [Tahibacter amnicola]